MLLIKDPVQRVIAYLVVGAHLLFLVYIHMAISVPVKKSPKPLVIKTISASCAPQEKVAAVRERASPKMAVKVESGTQKKVPEKAPPIMEKKLIKEKKQSAPVKKPLEEKRERMSQKLLRDLEDSLAKLEAKPQKKGAKNERTRWDLPAPIDALHLDETPAEEPGAYDNSLIGYLHQTLNLPEHGEVKIQLTLKQDGTFVKLVVLKTESEKNRRYLEASLPHLRFPELQGNKKQETFVVTFCNEI